MVLDALAYHLGHYGPGPGGLVITDAKGDPIRRNALGHLWRRAALEAGVAAIASPPRHDVAAGG